MVEEAEKRNTILVAYDGSLAAQAATDIAIQLAKSQDMPIRGLHVVDDHLIMDTYAGRPAEFDGEPELASRAELLEWFEYRGVRILERLEARCHSAGVPIVTELLFGGVPEQIVREAAQASLLAIGRRGHAQAGQPSYLGSNCRAITHGTNVPLLVGGNAQPSVKRILLAYDGSECAQPAMQWSALAQQAFSAQVTVLPLWRDGDGASARDREAEDETHLSQGGLVDYRVVHLDARRSDGIASVATEEQADMIVLGACRHNSFPGRLFDHSEDSVLRHTEVPLILT
jgi:nucleotide-binding universal stress UspA family protein